MMVDVTSHKATTRPRPVLSQEIEGPESRSSPDSALASAEDANGQVELDQEEYLDRLIKLRPIELDRELKAAAKRLGVSIGALREELKCRAATANTGTSVSLVPEEPEPSCVEQEGQCLLEDLATEIRRYLVLPEDGEIVLAVWVLFSHCYETFSHYPYLAITSPVKGCGKSTVLDVLEHLVPRPLKAEGFSAPVIYRLIEKEGPTLLIDELDTFIRGNDRLRGVLNSGYQRGGKYVCVVGDDHEPKAFKTAGPKVLATIGELPATLDDRSIHIRMKRKTAGDTAEGFGPSNQARMHDLKRRCIRWASDNSARLAGGEAANPFDNRKADRWRPLLSIAATVGGPWVEMIAGAAQNLEGRSERSLYVDLLADIRTLFDSGNKSAIRTQVLLTGLNSMEDRPWSEFSKGRPLTGHALARVLKSFGIASTRTRLNSDNAVSVYLQPDFTDAWNSYLPARGRSGPNGTSDTSPADVSDVPIGSK
jgi:hypothetical protein